MNVQTIITIYTKRFTLVSDFQSVQAASYMSNVSYVSGQPTMLFVLDQNLGFKSNGNDPKRFTSLLGVCYESE